MSTRETHLPANRVLPGRADRQPRRQAGPAGTARQYRTDGNGLAVPAMVLGVTGLVTSAVVVGGLLGVLGLVVGTLALRTSRRTGTGRSQAVTALVTSSLAIVLSVAAALFAVWFAHRTQSCYPLHDIGPWSHCVREQLDHG